MMDGDKDAVTMSETDLNSSDEMTHQSSREGIFAKLSRRTARYAWIQFAVVFAIAAGISVIGIQDFEPAVDNDGWISRGTLIADRSTQYWILARNLYGLATSNNKDVWTDLTTNPQPNFEDVTIQQSEERRLATRKLIRSQIAQISQRYLQSDTCDAFYSDTTDYDFIEASYHLAPVWKTKDDISALDPRVIQDICEAEKVTMDVLFEEGHCYTCDGSCHEPISLVLFARFTVDDKDFTLSCEELAAAWAEKRSETEEQLVSCVEEVKATYSGSDYIMPDICPPGFYITMVDESFGATNKIVKYTSSIFLTEWNDETEEALYELVDQFGRAEDSNVVVGAYDNEAESFGTLFVDTAVQSDMILAMASGLITTVAILVHTRSPWITLIGLLQIIYSFPLSYFFYTFVLGLNFFPFLNFIGVFVVFALGADDVFVAMDKWKNGRIDYPTASTEDVAAIALPDSASAMLLTTTTTAVAFFATVICPVAPLRCFAIFCGLLIVFDYIMCVLLIFPALCIYDRWLLRGSNQCCAIACCGRKKGDEEVETSKDKIVEEKVEAEEGLKEIEGNSFIRRVILGYYSIFHKLRWIIFAACLVGTVLSGFFAARLDLPTDSEVRLVGEDVEYEQAFEWRNELLSTALTKSSGSPTIVVWGAEPADTGDYMDPKSGSKLVLDDTFDPSSKDSQTFLLDTCENLFDQEFAKVISSDFVCPLTAFDQWLKLNSNGTDNMNYVQNCDGANGIPVSEENFNKCISAWSVETGSDSVLQRNGIVEIILFFFQGRVRYDSPFNELNDEWNMIEDWMDNQRLAASDEVNKMYATSIDFWWYDTNGSMLRSAYQSAGIALAFSGLVVLLSSRSFILTLFALITIAYVLASTTAMLVASGWTLGFLESICFAILIGISCDFVLHFCHAYAHLPGEVSRHDRTKYALVRMGPSILAAAFTTICSAAIMLFTVVSFFQQFATILFYTIIQATVGSFIVFTSFADCIGPSNPTYLFDSMFGKCCGEKQTESTTTKNNQEEFSSERAAVMKIKTGDDLSTDFAEDIPVDDESEIEWTA